MLNTDLENEIDQSKAKARAFLQQKELQERRLKITLQKLEAHMTGIVGMSQDEVNSIGQMTEDEL